MRHDRIRIDYELAFTAPFHCGTGLRTGLIDRAVRRDADGFLVVPGSTLKGLIRQQCEQIVDLVARRVHSEFGQDLPSLRTSSPHSEPAALGDYRPTTTLISRIFGSRVQTGGVYFDDAALTEQCRAFFDAPAGRPDLLAWQTEERTQVSMDRATGTARSGFLFTSEYGTRDLAFAGRVYGVVQDWPLPDEEGIPPGTFALVLLLAGIYLVERMGSQRSTGNGTCTWKITDLRVNGKPQQPEHYLQQLETFAYFYAMACGEI